MSLCRPGNEALLSEALRLAGARTAAGSAGDGRPTPVQGGGWVAWQPPASPGPGGGLPAHLEPAALVFERQRLPRAEYVPGEAPADLAGQLAAAALEPWLQAAPPHALHVFPADPTGARAVTQRAAHLERLLGRTGADRGTVQTGEPARDGTVWQVAVAEHGAWWAVSPAAALADPFPGGVHRMPGDPAAPSRSYLKIEEALDLLAAWGIAPRARERVIDLGAAPGGWSYAFLKRGCRVLAVDNGPLKLAGLDALPGTLTHLRADGLRLQPPPGWVPADWLLSDMLVAPGVCLGLLRKWIEAGWMRRCVVNVKLPQRDPLVALRPLREYLAGVPGLRWRMRQLYHDRREVTVLADASDAAPVRSPERTAQPARAARPRGRTPTRKRRR